MKSTRTLDAIDRNREEIMKILTMTISNDAQLKREVVREVRSGALVRQTGEEVLTSDKVRDAHIKGDEQIAKTDDLRRRIQNEGFRAKVAQRSGKSWEDMDPEARETF